MTRANRFELGIDVNLKPYLTWYAADGAHILTGADAVTANTWHRISFVGYASGAVLIFDSRTIVKLSGVKGVNDTSSDLVVSCTEDYTDFALIGEAVGVDSLINPSQGGTWVKDVQLTSDSAVRYIEATASIGTEHSGTVAVAFADTKDDLPYATSWAGSLSEKLIFPPMKDLYHGTWMRIKIYISAASWDRDVPLVDAITIHARPVSVGSSVYEEVYEGLPNIEEQTPENLEQLIADYKRLKPIVIDLKRKYVGGFGGFGWGGGFRRRLDDLEAELERLQKLADPSYQYESSHDWGRGYATQYWVMDQIWSAYTGLYQRLRDMLYSHASDTTNVHGIADTAALATQSYADTAVSNHASATTGVHGVGTSTVASAADIDAHNVDAYAHMVAGTQINDHINASSGVHGVGATYVAGQDYVDNAVANHSAASTGVHGVGTSYVASTADISNHAAATTGVHGVGSSYVASTADVTDAKNYADTAVSNHAAETTGIHGVGASTVCSVSYAEDFTNSAVSDHQTRCINYAT